MQSKRYLNIILTVIAVLLAGLLWVNLAPRPAEAMGEGFPTNPAAERQETNRLLRDVADAMEAQTDLLRTGKAKVQVTNLREAAPPRD